MSIQALREQRAAKTDTLKDLVKADRAWDAARDQPVYDAAMAEIEVIDAQISRIENVNRMAVEEAERNGLIDAAERVGHDKKDKGSKLFAKFLRDGLEKFDRDEIQIVQNAMSTTTGSEGGFTVQSTVAKQVIDAMKAYGAMREIGTVLPMMQGNPMSFPTSDGTAEEGEIVDQNQSATASDPTFSTLGLPVYKYSSKIIAVPFELLQDSEIDVEAFVIKRMGQRLGRITNRHFTTGTGSAQPNGVITAATVGKTGTTGQTTTVIYDDLVELEHSVDPAYRELGNCRFMMNDASVKVIKKLKDTQNRPIFLPGYDPANFGKLDSVLGYPVKVNQHVATMAANAKSIAFGDFSEYTIRDVMDITTFRFTDSAYTIKGQVGFLAWLRTGGNLLDVGGAVKLYQNSAS